MPLINLVVRAEVKQHDNFAAIGEIPFDRKYDLAIVATATRA